MTEALDVPFESGVDWLTVTSLTPNKRFRLETRAQSLLRKLKRDGDDERAWAMSGFQGFICSGLQLGWRGEDVIVRLTGETAFEHWKRFLHASDNCSRIDLQVTVRTENDVQEAIHRHYKEAKRHSAKLKRGPKVSVYSSSDDATTLYLGDRSSDVFGRCYNKGKEAKLDYYDRTIRYEAELKNDAAFLMAKRLAASSDPSLEIATYVSTFFRDRGCHLNYQWTGTVRLCRPRSRSTAQRRLTWLRENVRGSVMWLMDRGLEQEVMSALGLDAESMAVRHGPQ